MYGLARVSRKAGAARAEQPAAVHIYRTAIYLRLSDEDIRKKISDSIGTQKAMLVRFLQSQPDLQLYEVYEDVNYTGTNFNRPAFTRMIEDIQAGLVDCVLVKDLSRFGRSFEETGNYLEREFPLLGVRFISVSDHYDSLTASLDESSLIVPMKNLMNEVYARDISRKVQSSIKLKQKRGEFCGSFAPYGYIREGPNFVVDEEAATVVRRIFRWILEGMSDIAIAQQLNDLKILPPSRYRFEKGITKAQKHKETRFWYKSAVKRIAENPAYTGLMAQGKYKSNFLHGGGIIRTDSDEWIIVEGAHPAIIDAGAFEAVRRIRESRRQNYEAHGSRTPSDNIFRGLIVCGDCKAYMSRHKVCRAGGKDEYYFLCNTHEQVDKNACTRKKVMEADIQAVLHACISREISLAVNVCRIVTDMQKRAEYQTRRSTLDGQIEALQKKLEKNRRFRGSLREDYIDGILPEQDYHLMRADYDKERDCLQKELDALFAEKHRRGNTLSTDNKWVAAFRRFETERSLSGQMVSALVERIEVYGSIRIVVTLRYCDEFEALRAYVENHEREAGAANG